jgi:uncharacterized protein YqeY
MQEQIERDLKAALLSGDKKKVETLRVVKSALLNEAIAKGARDSGLSDEQVQAVLARESKKRSEAVELYQKADEPERASAEMAEKAIIDNYLPAQLSEAEISELVNAEVDKINNPSSSDMGRIIGAVRAKAGASADGAVIARLVKEKLS